MSLPERRGSCRSALVLATLVLAAPVAGQGIDAGFGDLNRSGGGGTGIFTSGSQSYFDSLTGSSGVLGQGTAAPSPVLPTASASGPEAPGSRIFWQNGRRYIRVRLDDAFADMALEAYGEEQLWYLIYYQNRQVFQQPRPRNGELVLWLPPAPHERIHTERNPPVLEAIPGDTFVGIAADLYGDPGQWTRFYQANRDRLPRPADPWHLFLDPPRQPTRQLLVPAFVDPSTRPDGTGPGPGQTPTYPGGRPGTPTGPVTTPTPPTSGRVPGPLGQLRVRGPQDIGEAEARIILEAAGFYDDRIFRKHSPPARNRYEAALMALSWGKSYDRPRGRVALDGRMRQWIFEEHQLLSRALAKYGAWPTVSARTQPQAYDAWIRKASGFLTEVRPDQREALMRSLMTTESGKTHWVNHKPVVSHAGAVGFGQFLPATAKGLGINPYDPEENMIGIALYLNRLIRQGRQKGRRGRSAVQWALAAYNGGTSFPSSSVNYAEGILGRLPGRGSMVA